MLAAKPRCFLQPVSSRRQRVARGGLSCEATPQGEPSAECRRGASRELSAGGVNLSRRVAFFAACVGLPAFNAAAEADSPPDAGSTGQEEVLSPSASRGENYVTKYYSYYVPRGWEPVDLGKPDQTAPSIESRFESADGSQSVSVTATEASKVKPTFFQLQDISELGEPDAVFRMTVAGAKLLRSSSQVIEGEERDTGTIRGVVKQPDQTLYFYEAAASKGRRLFITVAAKQGKIFKAKCAAPEPAVEGSSEVGATLETVAKSFRLK